MTINEQKKKGIFINDSIKSQKRMECHLLDTHTHSHTLIGQTTATSLSVCACGFRFVRNPWPKNNGRTMRPLPIRIYFFGYQSIVRFKIWVTCWVWGRK